MYGNELSVPVFVLMPVLLLFVVPLALVKEDRPPMSFSMYLVLFVLLFMQVLSIAVTMLTVARFYYDFVPIMMITSYLGALWLKRKRADCFLVVVLMAAVSTIVSFSLPVSAMSFYLGK